jgi:hypothetical protein
MCSKASQLSSTADPACDSAGDSAPDPAGDSAGDSAPDPVADTTANSAGDLAARLTAAIDALTLAEHDADAAGPDLAARLAGAWAMITAADPELAARMARYSRS